MPAQQKYFLNKAYNLAHDNTNDSIISRKLSEIAYRYLLLKDTLHYKKVNKEARFSALKLNDTLAMADTYWNDANMYKKLEIYDSAYYHYNAAYKYFEAINEQDYSAKMLFGMASVKGIYRDYTGSEVLIIKAISKYKELNNYRSLYSCYNYLALLQRDIRNYDKALYYNKIAQQYLKKIDSKVSQKLKLGTLNNIGLVYLDRGNYTKALESFNDVLSYVDLKIEDIEHYARVIDNRAYCKFLNGDTLGVVKDFNESLKIRNDAKNKNGIVICKLHMAEYFSYIKDTANAVRLAKEAKIQAIEIRNSRDYLAALKILSKIDLSKGTEYLNDYLNYNDSILNVERNTINKFTRIDFETDEYIKENERLTEHKKWIIIAGFGLLLVLSLVYYIRMQKIRTKNLLLEAEQQKANEEVYQLTIEQQFKLEEEKRKERNRISEELHDGILSNLFGVRMKLGFLKLKEDKLNEEDYDKCLSELQVIENDIRSVSHQLNSEEKSFANNFKALLKSLIGNKSKISGFTYELNINDTINWSEVNEKIKVNLYRILQEILQNIIKHSEADKVSIDLNRNEKGFLIMSVKDNGIGFDMKKIDNGIGIQNIHSRAKKIKGTVTVKTIKDRGTKVELEVPIIVD